MTFVHIGNGLYTCLSTDTKVTTGMTANSIAIETDTGNLYRFTGGAWSLLTTGGGGGGGAPTTSQYVTLATDATLTAERVLTAGTNVTLTDAGAGSTLTIGLGTGVTTNTGTQTLTNKTIDTTTNTITGIADANITAHTTTKITTTSKSLLNSSIVYTDQANTFGASAQTFKSSNFIIRNPADTFGYVFVGGAITTANKNITLPLLTGNDVMVTEAFAQTLTNKTLTSPIIGTISNTGTLTLPTSTDTLVGRATTDTLTNKTLTSPVIGTIVNTGTLTLPTATDTIVGRATTDTLTNKTMSGASNTFSNIPYSSLTSVPTTFAPSAHKSSHVTGGSDAFAKTDVLTSVSRYIETRADPASDSSAMWINSNAQEIKYWDTTTTTPVLRTLANLASAQTLTNKTLTSPVISSISNTGTITLPTSTDTLVGRATTDTLTNKTLTAPIISTITNTGTLTLPTSTDTLVGRATTDTLTNKTMSGASNTFSNIPYSALTSIPSTIVKTDQANTFGAFDQTIPSTRLKLSNSGFAATLTVGTLAADVTITLPSTTSTLVISTDSRLSDARTPTAHATSHNSGGSDVLHIDTIGAGTDITTNNVSTTKHGLVPKAPNVATQFLDGTGVWSTPAGSGGGEANTASNFGSVGTGVWKDKSGVDLRFYKLNSVDTKLTIAGDGTSDHINFTVNEGNLTLANLSGTIGDSKISDLAYTKLSSVPTTLVKTDQTNTFGAFNQIFPSTRLLIKDATTPANYIIATSAITADRTVTLPLLTGNDTLVTAAFAQTLTNKTMSGASNTFSAIPYSALTSVPSTFAPSAHKSSHVSGGGDAFAKTDILAAPSRYIEETTDPASDSGRIWINSTSQEIEYWDTLGTPVQRTLANLASTQTLTNKTMSGASNTFSNIPYSALTSVPSTFAPSAHASSHNSAGSDVVHIDTIGAGTDITTNNVSTTKHGLAPKLSNTSTQYLSGVGTWTTPAGGTLQFANANTYTIYNDAGTIKARNNRTGAIDYSNANLDPVIASILTTGDAHFDIQAGTFNLSAGFTGWSAASGMTVRMTQDTLIKVPQGYTGYVWNYGTTILYSRIEGGRYDEQGTAASNWTCFKFSPGSPNGALSNTIRDTTVVHANYAIHLLTATLSWINSNLFENIYANQCKYLVFFEHTSTFTNQTSGSNANNFINCYMQSSAAGTGIPQALGGIANVNGFWNIFNHCVIWDIAAANASAATLTITANAQYTTVVGGLLTYQNYSDLGISTTVVGTYPQGTISKYTNGNTYTIYVENTTVKARNNKTGLIQFSNANLDPVVTSILATDDAHFDIMSGTYNLSAGFTGWQATSAMTVRMQQDTYIAVPNAYTGFVWNFGTTTMYCRIEGGRYGEQGTAASNWTAFKFSPGSPNGALFNVIRDTTVVRAKYAIHLLTATLSWVNNNLFENILASECKYMIFFEHTSTFTPQVSGSNANNFINCSMEAKAASTGVPQALGAVANVNGWWNTFNHCTVYDISNANASAATMTITANAAHTLILGGLITHQNYSNLGTNTKAWDWKSLNSENTGKATASGNGSTTVFNIPHSMGANPTVAMVQCSSHTTAFTYTTDTTNIVVTFASAPPSGTGNVIFYWRAVT
jgi:hypothetical protein